MDTELHTARHTPAVGYIIFLQRCSGDTSVSSLAHQLMKSGWMKTAWLCIMKGCSIIFIKKCTLSFNFHKIPKIISDELELLPFFLSRIFCLVLCILCMCYEPCESFHGLWSGRPAAFPTHDVQTWTSDCSVFRVRSRVQAAVQRNAIAEPQEPTFMCVPRPIGPNQTHSCALPLWIQPQESTINWVPTWGKTSTPRRRKP